MFAAFCELLASARTTVVNDWCRVCLQDDILQNVRMTFVIPCVFTEALWKLLHLEHGSDLKVKCLLKCLKTCSSGLQTFCLRLCLLSPVCLFSGNSKLMTGMGEMASLTHRHCGVSAGCVTQLWNVLVAALHYHFYLHNSFWLPTDLRFSFPVLSTLW